MTAPKISKFDAYQMAKEYGIRFDVDVHTLGIDKLGYLHDLAKMSGYKTSKYANASTGVYFFRHLKKLKEKHGWR